MDLKRVLVTGSSGLIGRAVIKGLSAAGVRVVGFDIRDSDPASCADLRDATAFERHLAEVEGVIHLGAVSRVVWGEQHPEVCWAVNVDATRELLGAALRHPLRPWVLYASSREVYGEQGSFPVAETAQLGPLNTYARSKVAAEQLVWQAREAGLSTAVVRFSSVYGDVDDHVDRVVPAFASAAARGGKMHIDGADCIFDFTHVDDVAAGVIEICRVLSNGEQKLPALHFVSGVPTSLRELAEAAADAGSRRASFEERPPRTFDVARFWGNPARAAEILGWRSTISIKDGIAALVKDFEVSSGPSRPTLWPRVLSPAVSL